MRSCRAALAALAVVVAGCEGNEGGKGGTSPFGSEVPKDPSAAAAEAKAALESCTKSCSADVAAGRAALAKGNIAGALAAYECANTPEAAFGAGFATLLSAVETERMDRVLADFGFEPFAAKDVVGPAGLLARQAERWQATGMLALSGHLTGDVPIDSALVEEPYDSFDPGQLQAKGSGEALHVEVELYDYRQLDVGAPRSLLYDCTSAAGPATLATQLPSLYVMIKDTAAGSSYDCDIPFTRDSRFCQQELGSIEVVAAGTKVGEPVTIAFNETALGCHVFEGPGAGTMLDVTLSGTITAMVSGDIDTSGLHALLQDDVDYSIDRIPEDVTVGSLLAHATALSKDLAQAACLFERAAEGDGEVLSLPGGLLGGSDIALSAADAKLLGALAAGAAGALQLGGTYASELPLRDVACMLSDRDDSGACMSTAGHVAKVNAAIEMAGVRLDRLAAARTFLLASFARFRDAVPQLDAGALFPRNAASAAGLDAMATIAEALERSLDEGEAVLPFVSPRVEMHLKELLTEPPAPSSIRLDAFRYDESCDDFDCYSQLDLSPSFCSLLWAPIGVDFSGDYRTTEEGDQIGDAFDELSRSLEARKMFRGGDL